MCDLCCPPFHTPLLHWGVCWWKRLSDGSQWIGHCGTIQIPLRALLFHTQQEGEVRPRSSTTCILILSHLYFLTSCVTMHPAPWGQALQPHSGWRPAHFAWVYKDLPRTTSMRAPDKWSLMMMIWFSWIKSRPRKLMKNTHHSNIPVPQQGIFTRGCSKSSSKWRRKIM